MTSTVITRDHINITAPVDRIWNLQVEVNRWAEWQPDVTEAHLDGAFAPGSSFHWLTSGLDITSTIEVVERHHTIQWGGQANGITAVHRWLFDARSDGVVTVSTEESWAGEPIERDPAGMKAALVASLSDWLRLLKLHSESA